MAENKWRWHGRRTMTRSNNGHSGRDSRDASTGDSARTSMNQHKPCSIKVTPLCAFVFGTFSRLCRGSSTRRIVLTDSTSMSAISCIPEANNWIKGSNV